MKTIGANDVQNVIASNFGDDYQYISGYAGYRSMIEILHITCGRTFSQTYKSISKNSSCSRCDGRQKTSEDLILLIKKTLGNDFLYLSGYKNNHSPISIQHRQCNKPFSMNFALTRYYNKSKPLKCPICEPRSWNINLVKKHIKDNMGSNYEYVSGFKDKSSVITLLHKKCDREFTIRIRSITKTSSCKRCNGLYKTESDIALAVKSRMGVDFEYLSRNNDGVIKLKHTTCKKTIEFPFASLKTRVGCSYCDNGVWDLDKVKSRIKSEIGNGYEYVDGFMNADSIIRIKHLKCEHIFNRYIQNFNQKHNCPLCEKNFSLFPDEYKKKMQMLRGDEYELLNYFCLDSGHIDFRSKVEVLHTKCNRKWKTVANFIYGRSCYYCSSSAKLDTETYRKQVKDLAGNEYKVLDEYINSVTPIEHLHVACGHHFLKSPSNFKKGQRCPIGCEFSDNPRPNWKRKYWPYPIVVKPEKRITNNYVKKKR